MKKVLSVISTCLVIACVMAMAVAPVSAMTPKEEIIAAAREKIPAAYQAEYLPLLENILQQLIVTPEQAAEVIANMEAAAAAIETDKGGAASNYTAEEQAAVIKQVQSACETLGLDCEVKPVQTPNAQKGDVVLVVTDPEGNKIADVNNEVKKTNVPDSAADPMLTVATVGLIVAAAVAAVYSKRIATSH